jgi:hypothetical protein
LAEYLLAEKAAIKELTTAAEAWRRPNPVISSIAHKKLAAEKK